MDWLDEERHIAPRTRARWRKVLHKVIFEADTPVEKGFDVLLIISILVSVAAVMLDSIAAVRAQHGSLLYKIEWFFTLLFTAEYILRLLSVGRPVKYATSFRGGRPAGHHTNVPQPDPAGKPVLARHPYPADPARLPYS